MKTIIISLGGSIIVPDKVNVELLSKFKNLINTYDHRFVLVTGGGSIAREYQDALKKLGVEDDEALDWMGISATHLNGFLVKALFGDLANEEVISDPTKDVTSDAKIIIAGGYKPGWSTDYDAVLLAKNLGANTVINLSNIDQVYNKDPKEFRDAKPLKNIDWDEIISIVGDKWSPGLNMPFDPIAAKEAKDNNIKVIIANGNNIDNLKKILDEDEDFVGTTIQ